jgi:hypothetical protein
MIVVRLELPGVEPSAVIVWAIALPARIDVASDVAKMSLIYILSSLKPRRQLTSRMLTQSLSPEVFLQNMY